MNGTEQRNARMSLATDILRNASANLSPPPPRQKHRDAVSAAKKRLKEHKPERIKLPTGVYLFRPRKNGQQVWRSMVSVDNRMRTLGEFRSPERAAIAYRLFRFWQRRGFENVPNCPSKRLYIKW